MLLHQWGMLSDFLSLKHFTTSLIFAFTFIKFRYWYVRWTGLPTVTRSSTLSLLLHAEISWSSWKLAYHARKRFKGVVFHSSPQKPANPRPTILSNCFSNGNLTNQQWDIFSYNYPLGYLPWEMQTLWSQKCNYFTYLCKLSWRKSWNPEKKWLKANTSVFYGTV